MKRVWRKLSAEELMLLNCGVGEDSWESLGLQRYPTSASWRRSVLGVHWKDWWWSWNSNTLATLCEELTHWKRPWCWEGLGAGGEGDDRGWDGWMASPTHWTWVWVNSGSWWWTRRPGELQSMGVTKSQDMTEGLNWTELAPSCLRHLMKSLWLVCIHCVLRMYVLELEKTLWLICSISVSSPGYVLGLRDQLASLSDRPQFLAHA